MFLKPDSYVSLPKSLFSLQHADNSTAPHISAAP